MGLIKTKQQQILSPSQQPQRVGPDIGARRQYLAQTGGISTTPVAPKPASDKFGTAKKTANLSQFNPNAKFIASTRARFMGKPHKPAVLHYIENGLAPVAEVKPPSDAALINLLEKVMNTDALANSNSVRKAATKAAATAAPAQKVTTQAQRTTIKST